VPTPRDPHTVLFDLDDTLFDHAYGARAALAGVHAMHECFRRGSFTELEANHARCLEELHARVVSGELDIDTARLERFRRLFESAGVDAGDELLRQTAAAYRARYLVSRRPSAGAVPLLAALKSRVKIGIVSNNLLEEQQEKVRVCGFEPYVDALIVSEQAGVAKPDPAIFAIALDRLGGEAGRAVMIGDSWENDVEGARAANMRAIWLNRNGDPMPARLSGVREIKALEPLDAVLAAIFVSGVQCASA
jgi:HAD superfamily hydrolase (TIGR01549 family)